EAEYGGHDQIDLYDDVISPSANNGDAPEDRDYMDTLPPTVGDDVGKGAAPNVVYTYTGKRIALYIGNLTWWTTDEDLTEAVHSLGVNDILEIKFFENRANGQSKGFALVGVGSEASSKKLMDLLPKRELHGQNPVVTPCNKQFLSQFEMQSRKIFGCLQLHNQDKCLGKVKLVLREAVHVQHFHKVVEDGAVFQGLFLVGTDFLGQQDQEGHLHLFQLDIRVDYKVGDYGSAIETLVTAISLIKQSKVSADDRCKVLISSLQDCLHGIESKSYGSGSSRDRHDDYYRERSRERERHRDRDRDRDRERDREREYRH
ncbi:CPSF6, partial [Cervus elaphus hippelaphus]